MLAHLLGRSAAIRDALDNATRMAGDDPRVVEAAEAAYAELKIAVRAHEDDGADTVIPFGTQRAGGQDLAMHLLNEQET